MFSLRRSSSRVSKTLYTSVLTTTLLILVASFLVFDFISNKIERDQVEPLYDRMDMHEIENARSQLQKSGKDGLSEYMVSLDRVFGGVHSLLDPGGKDVVTGVDKSYLLPGSSIVKRRGVVNGQEVLVHKSSDGLYWLASVSQIDRPRPWMFLPYYFLVIGETAILCWLVAVGVVSPLRKIAGSIAKFGEGDLTTRIDFMRKDEIGQLGRSFNQMAERLGLLIESERTLLSDISHELRSPLARLKVAVKLARTAEDKDPSLNQIERDIDRLTSILSDVVEITLVEGDPALKEKDSFDLQSITKAVVQDCSLEAKMRDCALAVDNDLKIIVEGNPELLRRAIENVIRNAIRYSPSRSEIRISLAVSNNNAVVCVRDYGTGVPEKSLTRIFDPFFRVEQARDTTSGSTGLGLSIARRAVSLHQGQITAQNASPGLLVTITIPLNENYIQD
jgi:signal transduction histidine kinase